MFNDSYYSCDSGKLYLLRGLEATCVCDLPEIHAHQLFVLGRTLYYLSRYGTQLY